MAKATFAFYIDWDNDGSVDSLALETGEDVTARVLGVRTPLNWRIGRDGDRSLSGFLSGDIELEINNVSRDYSPDNASSPLFGKLGPGKPVRIRATSGTTRDIFRGFINEYNIDPFREEKSLTITCIDAFAKVADTMVSTELFKGISTGEALNKILDAIGWPAGDRDIDPGCTVIPFFWVDAQGAGEAIKDVLASEGPPAVCYVDGSANFVFKDRAHRLLDTASTATQATFRDTGSEPLFSPPAEYNVGFGDLVNHVVFEVEEREARVGERESGGANNVSVLNRYTEVWQDGSTIRVPASSSITIIVQGDEPFEDAQEPEEDEDYILVSGSLSSISLSRTSGQSTTITLTGGASGAVLEGLRLRAIAYPVARQYLVEKSDATSITKYGKTSWTESTPKWVNRNDAEAIAGLIIALRAERLPVFNITVNNGGTGTTRLGHILDRKVSDRVTIVETETATNHSHYIEAIEYSVEDVGFFHTAQFMCEREPTWAPSASTVFILDSNVSGHRLDSGRLAY